MAGILSCSSAAFCDNWRYRERATRDRGKMIRLSQKCLYALRTVLELAGRRGDGPVSVREISEAQAIPYRFLERIIAELRSAGVVRSQRGARGGYTLVRSPAELSVGELIRMFDGPLVPVDCSPCGGDRACPLADECVFWQTWTDAGESAAAVYDNTTFETLLTRKGVPAAPSG